MHKSNIYYIILDEYSGLQNLRNYYEYDNQGFYDELTSRKFNISIESRNAEGYRTITLVPNMLNLDYVASEDMTETGKLKLFNEPYLVLLLKNWGYSINTCSYPSLLDNSMSDRSYGEREDFRDKAGYYCLKNSVYIHVYNWIYRHKLERDDGESYGEEMIDAFNFYIDLSCSDEFLDKPCFNLGYFQTPHAPFFYKNDGSLNDPDDYYNWKDHTNYLESLEWTNHVVLEVVDEILENDKNAIIIIQSDHGARLIRHMWEIGEENEDDDTYYEHDIINCVYFHGNKLDIEGLSGLNTIRKVLNEEFGTNFNMLECPVIYESRGVKQKE